MSKKKKKTCLAKMLKNLPKIATKWGAVLRGYLPHAVASGGLYLYNRPVQFFTLVWQDRGHKHSHFKIVFKNVHSLVPVLCFQTPPAASGSPGWVRRRVWPPWPQPETPPSLGRWLSWCRPPPRSHCGTPLPHWRPRTTALLFYSELFI